MITALSNNQGVLISLNSDRQRQSFLQRTKLFSSKTIIKLWATKVVEQ